MSFENQTVTIDDKSEPGSWAKAIKETPMTNINSILAERGSRYGEFLGVSMVAQNIKVAMRNSDNWERLPPDACEALEMVANKLGRILNGDCLYVDSWRDAEGYLKLMADRLERCQNGSPDVNDQNQTENGN
jgi:hypothetical protein